jgi:glycosyltransferase involved in cell wall biosynthesis
MHWLAVILVLPYFFLLLKIYRGLLKVQTFNVSTNPSTYVSVLVACRNEEEKLPGLLDCIARQDYPKELLEVIIIDDNSTDKTAEIASGKAVSAKLIVIKNKGNGKKQAIKTGINTSSGLLIITTDADCRMGNNWIKTIAAIYEEHKPDMLICPVQLEDHPGFFGRFQELEFLSLQGITAGSALSGNGIMCNGANLSFPRETYINNMDKLHFELVSGDDIFMLHSIKKELHSKIQWLESADAVVTTASSSTIWSFFKQRKRWISKGKAYNDGYTILIGVITFVTALLQLSVIVSAFINPAFIMAFITIFLLKSIPDFLILLNTSGRYGKTFLMRWFLPAQFVYPFYVLSVGLSSLIPFKGREN